MSRYEYKRKNQIRGKHEHSKYLRRVHNAMADCLFNWHMLRAETSEEKASIGYINDIDEDFWLETFFDECGDTCHRLYDIQEARRLTKERDAADFQSREREIEQRRAQIHLVESE